MTETMTAVEFIETMFCSQWTFDEPQPMTPDEARTTIDEWKAEGILEDLMMPPTVTPLLFSRYWNILCEKHYTAKA